MKKLLLLFTMLIVGIGSTWGQQVTNRASAGDPLTFNGFKALAGTGKHFAIVASSDNTLVYPKWFSFATGGYPETLTTAQLFDLENSATGDGWYNIKRVSDGKYVSTEGGNFDTSTKMDFKLVNRRSGDYASEFSNSDLHVSLDNAAGNHYNANTTNLGFRGGTGGYSTYITYGPLYVVTVNYIDSDTKALIQTSENVIMLQGTIPSLPGYNLVSDPTSGAGITSDGTYTFEYTHKTGVSGDDAWLDYTFNMSTIAANTHNPADRVIDNAGNAGVTDNNLTIDTGYDTDNSYNEDGTLKVMSTPYRRITWPTNYTVAVAGNVPDVANGCLVAFGSTTAGSKKYLAIIRGANQNEIKLVKGSGNSAFEVISTMTASNATELSHLVVFTKTGNTFNVYLDGINIAQTSYSETLGDGFQIGSIHGGVTNTGIARVDQMSDAAKAKVFAKAIRVYDYVITEEQMAALKAEFPYVSYGGKYSRTITENSDLSATDAWLNASTQGNVDVPVNAVVGEVTYYPDVEITTTAASTLTVNADMDVENMGFKGTGKLSIASDGTHNIHVYGSVAANAPVSIKYGETDLSAVPVAIGESGSVEFDFSDYDFSAIVPPAVIPLTGNTSDYGNKVTGIYPSNDTDRTYAISHDETSNRYILTISPTIAFMQQQVIALVAPYYNGQYVGTGVGKYTISLGETSYANMADFGTAVMSWQSLDDYVEPTITFNLPTTGYYRIKGYSNNYITSNTVGSNASMNGTDSENNIVYYSADKYLIFYGTGYGLYNTSIVAPVGSTLNSYTFSEGVQKGHYFIKSNYSDGGQYCYDNTSDGTKVDRNSSPVTSGNYETDWILEPVTSLPLETTDDGYTSFSAPVAVTIPDNCYAYIATSEGTDVINMTKVTGNVAANTGMIISTDGIEIAGPLSFEIAESGTEYSNLLVANVAAANVSKTNNYFFGKVGDNYVFTQLSGDGDYYTLPGHKAYLNLGGNAARLSINWGGDDATGLSELSNEVIKLNDGKYYQNGTVIVVRNGVKYNVAGQTIK
ncbi:MAG: hypothetical protein J5630_00760 [Bacteroidaceae bacterium]|nr:hypothetical protein [Bacteroidaceae bacterium]